jgi:hypothetical protein
MGAGPSSAKVTPTELAEARNNVRTTLLQGLGGFVLLVGAYLTWRQTQISRAPAVTNYG